MIDVAQATELVKHHRITFSSYDVHLERLVGQVLAAPIKAKRQQPPFDRVAMDGIAINFNSLDYREFPLLGVQKAGQQALALNNTRGAIEVMTGAPLPQGTDTVIPYEVLRIEKEVAYIPSGLQVKQFQNIHFKGSDYIKGNELLPKGTKLTSADVAIIASQGMVSAKVVKFPKIAVISTGDELVEPGEKCEQWQIWRSNPYAVKSELVVLGIPGENIELYHLPDERQAIFDSLSKLLKEHDVLILSGGISMGKFDFVHSMITDLGIGKIFHKIKQKPGKPMLFGKGHQGQCLFGLPGNPVSALMCLRRYVIPSIQASMGWEPRPIQVVLDEEIKFKPGFTLFKAVTLRSDERGRLVARPVASNGSGDFSSLAASHGFIELCENEQIYNKGTVCPFFAWGSGLF